MSSLGGRGGGSDILGVVGVGRHISVDGGGTVSAICNRGGGLLSRGGRGSGSHCEWKLGC